VINNFTLYNSDCQEVLVKLGDSSIDLVVTDPPYGLSFMGKDWDRAVPSVEVWGECLRVLKPGAFAFVMCIPRQDCLARMIVSLSDAGFETGFTSMYWAYASGFPKAANVGKKVDTQLGLKGEVIGKKKIVDVQSHGSVGDLYQNANKLPMKEVEITTRVSPQAKALDGSYAGFQPKPAVEVILVCMKPLSEKTYVDQALKNQKGITWLDDCRMPTERNTEREYDKESASGNTKSKEVNSFGFIGIRKDEWLNKGRFPANLLVSDDVLNDGRDRHKSGNKASGFPEGSVNYLADKREYKNTYANDSGSFSRYFDLDKWYNKTFPFFICPKASKSEKNRGCGDLPLGEPPASARSKPAEGRQSPLGKPRSNSHPTVKPLKLMSYLITLGSREGDTVLDPYMGSGTTCLAAKMLGRKCIGIEIDKSYFGIAEARNRQMVL